ncbi:hypothetical protein [Flavisolibacter ginsenosidimutans]|uniref:Uncharacterized protein n=1 Tax=Flavisolibacter ginsenosidimutans TaxID=661481 RepID=A0A5B8UP42_9BACT|nr:hypothetical protein [Flavisolibacter ginsenosidimutans]QEC57725.1 hypothetical protein FSB75_18055 [Flavisolibacter ginsenosidimutans]
MEMMLEECLKPKAIKPYNPGSNATKTTLLPYAAGNKATRFADENRNAISFCMNAFFSGKKSKFLPRLFQFQSLITFPKN